MSLIGDFLLRSTLENIYAALGISRLVDVLDTRYFAYIVPSGNTEKSAFLSDKAWAAFARPITHFEVCLESEFGPPAGWDQSVTAVLRQMWLGELDTEFVKASDSLPESYDNNKQLPARSLLGRLLLLALFCKLG